MIISNGPLIRCVGAVVHDQHGRLLLICRAQQPSAGKWSLPGGRVETGESDHSAVQRELREEAGLSVIVGALVGRVFRPATHGTYEVLDYSCRSSNETLFPGDDASDAMWTDAATFATLDREGALTPGLVQALHSWDCLPRND